LVAKHFNITLQDRFETCPYNKNKFSCFTFTSNRRFFMNYRIKGQANPAPTISTAETAHNHSLHNTFTHTMAAIVLTLLLFTPAAFADTAAQLALQMNGWNGGGTGSLSAVASGNTVTVTGNVTNATAELALNIDSDVTVKWQATLGRTTSGNMVRLDGGTFNMESGSINSTATGYCSLCNNTNNTLNISGGTVSNTTGNAVSSYYGVAINISGGTVSSTTGNAVRRGYGNGKITVSGTAKVTSENTNSIEGTIYLTSGTMLAEGLFIEGGTVENTARGNVIYGNYGSDINISGGTVQANTGTAVYLGGDYRKITVSGTAKVTSANTSYSGGTIFLERRSVGASPALFDIEGGTVENTASGNAVYDASGTSAFDGGTITISGGEVKATTGDAVRGNGYGTINISGGTMSATTGSAVYGSGTVNITGGTMQATTGIAAYGSSITLGGNPSITGRIYYSTGKLSVVTGSNAFAPSAGKIYTLDLVNYANDYVAVVNGATFSSNFKMQNDKWFLVQSGSNLIAKTYYYYITGGGTSFTARMGSTAGEVVTGANGVAIQAVIDAIKTNANGNPCTIHFGDGTNTLEIGTEGIEFNGTGNAWGLITLEGKITTSNASAITLSNGASVKSTASIINTDGYAIYNSSTGTIALAGGLLFAISESDAIFGNYTRSGDVVVIAWEKPSTGTPTYTELRSTDLSVSPSAATAVWDMRGGIAYANGANTGFLEIDGVTVNESYTVTVASGTGGGNYAAGEEVEITANIPPAGKAFSKWTSTDGITFDDANKESTTFTMPAKAVTVTATYIDLPPGEYAISVENSGHGIANASATHATAGTEITLTAEANEGYVFKEWEVVSGGVTITNNKFTMPANNVVVMAVFEAEGTDPIRLPQIASSNIHAYAMGNNIVLQNLPAGAKVEMYGLNGKLITTSHSPLATSHLGVQTIDVHAKGLYIVKAGTKIFRVAVR
jgi:hypothetical protein